MGKCNQKNFTIPPAEKVKFGISGIINGDGRKESGEKSCFPYNHAILKTSGREIAGDLGMPPDNVRTALVRARQRARAAMGRGV